MFPSAISVLLVLLKLDELFSRMQKERNWLHNTNKTLTEYYDDFNFSTVYPKATYFYFYSFYTPIDKIYFCMKNIWIECLAMVLPSIGTNTLKAFYEYMVDISKACKFATKVLRPQIVWLFIDEFVWCKRSTNHFLDQEVNESGLKAVLRSN